MKLTEFFNIPFIRSGIDFKLWNDTKHDIFPSREKRKQTYFSEHQTNQHRHKMAALWLKAHQVCCPANRFRKIDLDMLTANPGKNFGFNQKKISKM